MLNAARYPVIWQITQCESVWFVPKKGDRRPKKPCDIGVRPIVISLLQAYNYKLVTALKSPSRSIIF